MTMHRSSTLRRRRATAALEFALGSPVLLMFLGGAADFGLAGFGRARLTEAVSAGAQYAAIKGGSATASAIKTMVETSSTLKASDGTSLVTATIGGPSWYCLTGGNPPTKTASTSGATCADGTAAGQYVTISATYTYTAILPLFSNFTSGTMAETATVRVQ
jgi:Flp pilus assembly protein TadG